jgi:shikimate dehydrogenase
MRRDFLRHFKGSHIDFLPLQGHFLKKVLKEADLLVNATSVGLKETDSPVVDGELLPRGGLLVYDLIYNPVETKFLRSARRKHCRTLNGLTMLPYQGAKAFEIWTGKKAPEALMRRELEKALELRNV